jgi:hypothetical protein
LKIDSDVTSMKAMPVIPSLSEACRITLGTVESNTVLGNVESNTVFGTVESNTVFGTVESNTVFVEFCLYPSQFVNLRLDPNVVNVCRL